MYKKYIYNGSQKFDIKKSDTNETSECKTKEKAIAKMNENLMQIDELQQKLYADKKEGLVIVFQAMDAAGKDGTIRSVLSCLSPHGVQECAFKAPSSIELGHDFLWRIHQEVPMKGDIAIFNRSHYEDVLIGKVKKLYESQAHAERINLNKVIENRYKDINHFEEYLYNNNVRMIKIFLNVSKKEQAARFLSRIEEPEKNWKFSEGDFSERQYWDAYQEAFEDAINNTASKDIPWYVVPADHKWYMRYIVSEIILSVLKDMNPQYPVVTKERLDTFEGYRQKLMKELPKSELAKVEEKDKEDSTKAKKKDKKDTKKKKKK